MRYTVLGKTGVRVSELALGTVTFGEDWGWGAPRETSARILDAYADAGGNFIDTADHYTGGTSETMLGELLGARRDRFVLSTKFTLQTDLADVNSAGNHRKNMVSSIEASLRRLRTDYLDLLWVHAHDTLTPVPELMRALDDQVRAGKIRYVGVSNWPAWEVAQANTMAELRDWSPFVGMQIRYNLLERGPERDLLPMARQFDLPVFCWGALAEGRLTGKYLEGGTGRLTVQPRNHSSQGSDALVREVVAIAAEGGWTAAQVALAWLMSRPGTVIPLLGATKEYQLQETLGAAEVRLAADQLERLDAVSSITLGYPHDLLRDPITLHDMYGPGWQDIEDRRTTVRRGVADDAFHPVPRD
ncbi:aldo/keto reductase [Streptomyces marincola]|uniref:Aldo/keto reductase n=1 Tax=Streptomyces marincola TaxID=2878388 RepID=A0A1W7D0R5_9ACTN|nr:aldo/keto reductase [Streptomyces marincola]ARQ70585.1 aldo/keto reductase [Streptomyces marincola]UCM88172.1 aldo/keto reductase [Streptomyces marincola]